MEVTFTVRIDEATVAAMQAAMRALSTAATQGLAAARQVQEQRRAQLRPVQRWPSRALSDTAAAGCPCLMCQAERRAAGFSEMAPPADEQAKASLWQVLERPEEALAVQRVLRMGMFDGRDANRCLIGIVAACRGMTYTTLEPYYGRTPAEDWVIHYVHTGMTPANNARAALLDQWLTEWLEEHKLPQVPAVLEPIIGQVVNAWDALNICLPVDYGPVRQRSYEGVSAALGLPPTLLRDEPIAFLSCAWSRRE